MLLVPAALAIGAPLAAQAPHPARLPTTARPAATITADDLIRQIGVIAHDSMLGRDTPSPGLEATARYVAGEFKRHGLRPGGDRGTFFQRYAITRRKLDVERSVVVRRGPGGESRLPLRADTGPAPRAVQPSSTRTSGTSAQMNFMDDDGEEWPVWSCAQGMRRGQP